MIFMLFMLFLIILLVAGFNFSRTTKKLPSSWYEWKTELRYQYIGFMGLVEDFMYSSYDNVELSKQSGRIAVITGGNRGIGLRIVEKLLNCQMTVIMGVRDPATAKAAVDEMMNVSSSGGKLICENLDISDTNSIKEFAKKVKQSFDKVDILINNAGIMFAPYKLSSDGFESHLVTNHLGHFLLTHLLMPLLKNGGEKSGKNARILNISSCVNKIGRINYKDLNATKYYYPGTAYAQSKLAQILATRHLQNLLDAENSPVQVNAVHPGIVDTDLFEHSTTTSVPLFKKIFFKTPEKGSRTVVFVAIDPTIEGKGGYYYANGMKSAVHRDAKDKEKCEKLFKVSCDLLKIKNFGDGTM